METTPFIEAVDHFPRVETSHLIKCRSPSFVVNLLLQWHIKVCFHGVSDDAIKRARQVKFDVTTCFEDFISLERKPLEGIQVYVLPNRLLMKNPLHWKRTRHIPLKVCYHSSKLHDVTSHTTVLFIITNVRMKSSPLPKQPPFLRFT